MRLLSPPQLGVQGGVEVWPALWVRSDEIAQPSWLVTLAPAGRQQLQRQPAAAKPPAFFQCKQ